MRHLIPPLLCALLGIGAARAEPVDQSDAERLIEGLPKGFRRPKVFVYPLRDERPLALAELPPRSAEGEVLPAWPLFLEQLAAPGNLKVIGPEGTREAIKAREQYRYQREGALDLLNAAYEDYREVRLQRAIDGFSRALRPLSRMEAHLLGPKEARAMGRAALTRGLAQLEANRSVEAHASMRAALRYDPTLRLRHGYDRDEAIAALQKARISLTGGPGSASQRLPPTDAKALGHIVIRPRVYRTAVDAPAILELRVRDGVNEYTEVQILGDDPTDDASRLASRVRACLPFGDPPKRRRHRNKLYVDAGFAWFSFLEAPGDGLFSNFGFGAHASLNFARNLSLDGHLALTNSNRDRSEDLRADIVMLRASAGPGFTVNWLRFRSFINVGFEIASPSQVVTTTKADCKFFSRDPPPPEGQTCDFPNDIDRVDRTLLVGAAAWAGTSLRLVQKVYLTLRVGFTQYFFDADDVGLDRPVGADLSLGYKF